MLNTMSPADAASVRTRSGAGALLLSAGPATPRDRAEMAAARWTAAAPVVAVLRPQARCEAALIGTNAQAAAKAAIANQQSTSQKYAHPTTRPAAFGGGALGPHSARDPV